MYIFDTKLKFNRRIDLVFLKCFGINFFIGKLIIAKTGANLKFGKNFFFYNKKIQRHLENFLSFLVRKKFKIAVGISLKNLVFMRLKDVHREKTIRSLKHSYFLPVRGQRTRKNAQTQKKKRKNNRILPVVRKRKK